MDCDLVLTGECAKCERAHSMLKGGDDPMASDDLARWMRGGLSAPKHGYDALRDFVETQNIARFRALLKTETRPQERKVLVQLLADEEARHTETVKSKRKQA